MNEFSYARPATIDDALALLQSHRDAPQEQAVLAGGTDLLTLVKGSISTPRQLVDIKRLPELDGQISMTEDGLRIGALATLAQLEDDPLVLDVHPALAQAAAVAATPQLRHMATIGGNLLQQPRCWYYRSHDVSCWRKGGDSCPAADPQGENQYHALFGDGPCYAVHPSDPATALLALAARVRVRDSQGERSIPLDEFFTLPTDDHRQETVLTPGSLITAIEIPAAAPATRSAYLKAMDRAVWAFALVGAAAQVAVEDGIVTSARLVLGGVAPIPWRVPAAEAVLIGNAATPEVFSHAAGIALQDAHPLAKNGYKIDLAKRLLERALTQATA
jgi:xanthine dehydrogenase YagS FAD-binding subunit